jgi:hypothetical protein
MTFGNGGTQKPEPSSGLKKVLSDRIAALQARSPRPEPTGFGAVPPANEVAPEQATSVWAHRPAIADESPAATAEASPKKASWFLPTKTSKVLGALMLGALIIVNLTSGFAGFLLQIGIVALITAGYVLVTGRRSWAYLPNRKTAAIGVAVSLVVMISGGAALASGRPADIALAPTASPTSIATVTPTPALTVAFTDEAAADPAVVAQGSEVASAPVALATTADTTALAVLATIPIKGRAPKTGYDRTGDFGTAWLDEDRNGCDTRNDILARDLTTIKKSGTCRVLTGSLVSPYTAHTISFVRGESTSALVQIDHLVALSNAWQTGAQQLTQGQRESLANDPLNLLAVDGRSNSQKGDGDTATWLPANKAFRCTYVARQVSVKATYGLWVTQAEHDAMTQVLNTCSGQKAMSSTFALVAVVTPAPVPAPAPVAVVPVPVAPAPAAPEPAAPAPAPAAPAPNVAVSYKNCDAVRAAGAAPIHRGDPGYSSKLDRDGDGVGCE